MHSIRLRGPWELYLPGSEQPLRIEMPATWEALHALCSAAAPLPSPARLVRRFSKPTGLSPQDRLHLVVESSAADCLVELNGQRLGSIVTTNPTTSFEITPHLQLRNELAILLPIPPRVQTPETSLPLGEVRLEITT